MSVRLARTSAPVGLLLAVFVVALNGTIMTTALPRISAELGALQSYVWVTTGYLMTSTVVQPIAGKLGDLAGRRSAVIACPGRFHDRFRPRRPSQTTPGWHWAAATPGHRRRSRCWSRESCYWSRSLFSSEQPAPR